MKLSKLEFQHWVVLPEECHQGCMVGSNGQTMSKDFKASIVCTGKK